MGGTVGRQSNIPQKKQESKSASLTGQCPHCYNEVVISRDKVKQLQGEIKIPCPACGRIMTVKATE